MAAGKRTGMDKLLAMRGELEDVSPPWTRTDTPALDPARLAESGPDNLPAALAAMLPEPREPRTSTPTLEADERAAFERCEQVLAVAEAMFWVEGLALETIALGELHREDYESFDEYNLTRGRSARRAYQLIEVAPLGRYLNTEVRKIFHTATINEHQTRTLLPLAKAHGNEAAALVLTTILGSGQKVTAALLKTVLAILPDRFDHEEATRLIKEYLAGGTRVLPPSPTEADPAEVFTSEARRLRTTISRTVRRPEFLAYARQHPDQARAVVAELRALLDGIEAAAGDPDAS